MNRQQLTSITVALACIVAVGIAATTLSSTLSSSPADAVTLNYAHLPIDSTDVSSFQQEIEATNPEDGDTEAGYGRDESSDGAGPGQQDQRGISRSDEGSQSAIDNGSGDLPGGGDDPGPGEGDSGGAGAGDGSGSGPGESEQATETDSSSSNLALLLALVALLLLAVSLLYRYRHWLAGRLGPDTEPTPSADGGWTGPPADENIVYAAWDALRRDVDAVDAAQTTSECATVATAAGKDGDAVAELARTFEAVRYGRRPVTDDRQERVSAVCQRLQLDLPEGVA